MNTRLFTFLLTFTLILPAPVLHAQQYDPAKVNKKARALYEQAEAREADGSTINAIGLLQQAVKTDSGFVEAWLALAGMYGQLKNFNNSIHHYEKAFSIDSVYTISYKQQYALQLAATGQFDKALAAVTDLLTKAPPKNQTALDRLEKRKKSYAFAVAYGQSHTTQHYVFAPVNLGSNINSPESEYFPCESLDRKELIFTRRIRNTNEDFYHSTLAGTDWARATPMGGDVNTPDNEAAQHISQDGQWLVFTANHPGGFGNFDIYIAERNKEGWSQPMNMGRAVNSDQWDSQPCLSPDNTELYFSSQRPGGFGGKDIYVCRWQANGGWSAPENLGPGINTSGNEECPFIHADNQTFYFTSNGLPGYGENDLFVARKNAKGEWSTPENLGYPINTINDEGTLFIASDAKTAYYASDRDDSYGGLDIYRFEMREDLRPSRTLWVQGQVSDLKTKKGLACTVELIDLNSKQVMNKLQTDDSGYYLVTLPVGRDYVFNINRKGYLFYSDNFQLTQGAPDSVYEKNIALQPLETNASIVLKNIFFESGKSLLNPDSYTELDILVKLLQDNPALRIEISGHTDNIGKPADNLLLSNNRAKAVVDYLVSKKIAATRLSAKGYGETKPVAANTNEEGRGRNRRTEVRVLGN